MRKISLIAAIFSAALLFSCQKTPDPILELSQTSFTDIPQLGGRYSLTLKANNDWFAACSDSWVQLSSLDGVSGETVVNIDVKATDNVNARKATVTFTSATLTQTVTLEQLQKNTMILKDVSLTVSKDAQTVTVKLNSNVDYSVTVPAESASWVERATKTKAYKEFTESFAVAQNTTFDERTAKIVFRSKDGRLTEVLSLTQKPVLSITVGQEEIPVAASGGMLDVSLNANTEVECVLPDGADWIRNATKGLSSMDFTFMVDSNADPVERSAVITFVSKEDPTVTASCTVVQSPMVTGELVILHDRNFFTMPELYGVSMAFSINWGDNTEPVPYEHGISHVYPSGGDYKVVVEVEDLEKVAVASMLGIKEINLSAF